MENLLNYLSLIISEDPESILLGLNLIRTDNEIYRQLRMMWCSPSYCDIQFDFIINNYSITSVCVRESFLWNIELDLCNLINEKNSCKV